MRFALAALVACNGKTTPDGDGATADADTDADSDTDTDTDSDSDSDSDADTDTTTRTIPDPYAGLDLTVCEGGGFVTNVSTAYYVGDLTVSGATFTGTETAVVHFSPNWVSDCGYAADCRVVWALQGDVVSPTSCGTCDYGLSGTAEVDPTQTDCPDERIGDFGNTQWTVGYDVQLNPDGTSELFFSASGNPMGAWYWAGDEVAYLTENACNAYPDDITGLCP